jgi:hypothetical protein
MVIFYSFLLSDDNLRRVLLNEVKSFANYLEFIDFCLDKGLNFGLKKIYSTQNILL